MDAIPGTTDAAASRDALVTGEAVLLDLRPASFAVRLASFLIDGLVELVIAIGGTYAVVRLGSAFGLDDGYLAAGLVAVTVAAFIGYPVLTELLTNGRSLGRLALGTRVVRDDGGPVHARQSLLRAVMAMFEIWSTSGAIALVVSLVDSRSRRLGDLLAGTFVLQERLRAPLPVRPEVPPTLRAWAGTADVGRLELTLLQDIRAFLPRAEVMAPESRRRIALDLVQRVVPSVAPPPPVGTDPEEFLRAVLAERSRRDEQRLREDLAREQELAAQVAVLPFRR